MSEYTTITTYVTAEELSVNQFRAYISPILVIIGVPGNILTVIVFSIMQYQSPCRFNLYPIALSIGHNIILIVNTLMDDFMGRGLAWVSGGQLLFSFDSYSSTGCKLITYITNAAALITAFILMLFSVDRVYDLYNPDKIKPSGGIAVTSLTVVVIYLICFLLCSADLTEADRIAINNGTDYACSYVDDVSVGVKYTLYLHIVGAIILPAVFIFITNILIVVKLRSMVIASRQTAQDDKETAQELRKTVALLTLSMLFSFLSFPLTIVIILRQGIHDGGYEKTNPEYATQLIELSKLFSSLKDVNDVFEFFIYLTTMPQFRYTFVSCLCCRCFQNDTTKFPLNKGDLWKQGSWFLTIPKLNTIQNVPSMYSPDATSSVSQPEAGHTSSVLSSSIPIKTRL